jgi:hypothetical protein
MRFAAQAIGSVAFSMRRAITIAFMPSAEVVPSSSLADSVVSIPSIRTVVRRTASASVRKRPQLQRAM